LGGFGGGWLTFDDGTERRRLAPVPENWERLSDVRLALLLRAASGRLERSPSIGGPIAAVTSGARANGACTTAGALANPPRIAGGTPPSDEGWESMTDHTGARPRSGPGRHPTLTSRSRS
jgi:hypothetical protein